MSESFPSFRSAQGVLFPAAAVHAILVLPASVHARLTGQSLLPGLASPWVHGQEMLFGFALAVVAGFLINRIRPGRLWLLFGLWLTARVTVLMAAPAPMAILANSLFALGLAWFVAPPFLRAAKKWRNRLMGPLILVLAATVPVYFLALSFSDSGFPLHVLEQGVLLLALLMAFMGGRLIAPAVAGYRQQLGRPLAARVQPRLEGVLLLTLLLALLTYPWQAFAVPSAVALLAAALLVLVRLLRWQLWYCRARLDLLSLGLGYGWLAVGLLALGLEGLFGPIPSDFRYAALHCLTVGALGTLTLTVMARTATIKARRHPEYIPLLGPAVVLVNLAALLRVTGTSAPAMVGAAALWSLAFALLLWYLWMLTPADRRGQEGQPG